MAFLHGRCFYLTIISCVLLMSSELHYFLFQLGLFSASKSHYIWFDFILVLKFVTKEEETVVATCVAQHITGFC